MFRLCFKEWFSSLLTEDYKSQKAKFMASGANSYEIDFYLNWFRIIQSAKPKALEILTTEELPIPMSDRKNIDKYATFNDLKKVVDKVFQDLGKSSFENSSYAQAKKRFMSQGKNKVEIDTEINTFKNQVANDNPRFDDTVAGVDIPANLRKDINAYEKYDVLHTLVNHITATPEAQDDVSEQNKNHKIYPTGDQHAPIEIYYAPDARACIDIKGKHPTTFCVSRPLNKGNLYTNYRYGKGTPAFYFVKNIEKTDKEYKHGIRHHDYLDPNHILFIQVVSEPDETYHKMKYIVTNADNNGDTPMTWEKIVSIEPNLNGLEHLFKPVPLSQKEITQKTMMGKVFTDEQFKDLPFEQKKLYIDVAAENINKQKFIYLGPTLQKDLLLRHDANIDKEVVEYIVDKPEFLQYALKSGNLDLLNKLFNSAFTTEKRFFDNFTQIWKNGSTSDRDRMAKLVGKQYEQRVRENKIISTLSHSLTDFIMENGYSKYALGGKLRLVNNLSGEAKKYNPEDVKQAFASYKNASMSPDFIKSLKKGFKANIFNIFQFLVDYDLIPESSGAREQLTNLIFDNPYLKRHMIELGMDTTPDLRIVDQVVQVNPTIKSSRVLKIIYSMVKKVDYQEAREILDELKSYPNIVEKLGQLTNQAVMNVIPFLKEVDSTLGFLATDADPSSFDSSTVYNAKRDIIGQKNQEIYRAAKLLMIRLLQLNTKMTENFKNSLKKIFGKFKMSPSTFRYVKQKEGKNIHVFKNIFLHSKEGIITPKVLEEMTPDEIQALVSEPEAQSKIVLTGELYNDLPKSTKLAIVKAYDTGRIKFLDLPPEDTWENHDSRLFASLRKQFMSNYARIKAQDNQRYEPETES